MDNSVNENNTKKEPSIFTKETFGMLMVLISALCFICLVTRGAIFSFIGEGVNYFLFGVFGLFALIECIMCMYFGVTMVIGKSINVSKKVSTIASLGLVAIILLVHGATTASIAGHGYGKYLGECYRMASSGIRGASGGGLVIGVIAYPLMKLFTPVGFYIITSVAIIGDVLWLVKIIKDKNATNAVVQRQAIETPVSENITSQSIVDEREPVTNDIFAGTGLGLNQNVPKRNNLNIANGAMFSTLGKREQSAGVKLNVSEKGLNVASQINAQKFTPMDMPSATADMRSKIEYIKTPQPLDVERTLRGYTPASKVDVSEIPTASISKEIKREDLSSDYTNNYDASKRTIFNDFSDAVVSTGNDFDFDDFSEKEKEITNPLHVERATNPLHVDKPVNPLYSTVIESKIENDIDNHSIIENPIEEKMDDYFETEDNQNEVQYNFGGENAPDVIGADKTDEIIEDVEPSTIFEREPIIEDTSLPVENEKSVEDLFKEVYGEPETFVETIPEEKPKREYTPRDRAEKSRVIDYVGNINRQKSPLSVNKTTVEDTKENVEEKPKEVEPINRPYFTPPLTYLVDHSIGVKAAEEDHPGNLVKIEQTLSALGIPATGVSFVQGPSITRYELSVPTGIPLSRVLRYDRDLTGALESTDGVRILAPIPGKNLIGIEAANKIRVPVSLREILEKTQNKERKKSSLMFAVGKSLIGEAIEDNLAKGPHYLVAGATGSGKSVFLNTMLISLIMRYSPEELKFILVDPKTVEFRSYEHLPHLVTDEIISDPTKVLAVLDWAYEEMERRYKVFHDCGKAVVDINGYNEFVASDTVQKMARIVIVIDELADLMQFCKRDLERKISALAAKARSAGIHLVLATQRPSVDVITGVIKANLPSRVAFKVMGQPDSMTILGESGAEKLLGNGDMLYKNSGMPNYERYQGAFITAKETNEIVDYIIKNNKAYFNDELAKYLEDAVNPPVPEKSAINGTGIGSEADDSLFVQALAYVIEVGGASISSLQRRFRIGFSKAGNYIDRMAELGYISGNEGSKARRVLITKEEFDERYGSEY